VLTGESISERDAARVLQVEDIWYAYGAPTASRAKDAAREEHDSALAAPPALRGVSVTINAGERVAVVGRNGSGKTTLARHLNGLLRPQRGRVLVNGLDTRAYDAGRLAAEVGYVFQNPDHQLFSPSVREEIAFGPRNLGLSEDEVERRVVEALASLNLEALAERPPPGLGFAQRRLVAIASALALRPAALVFDEPFAGLGWPSVTQIGSLLGTLTSQGLAVVVITHQMRAVAEFSERCIVLDAGQIRADGAVNEVLSDASLLGSAALVPPAVVRVGVALQRHGFGGRAVRVEDFVAEYRHLRGAQ
jgi:energy-coupling factor transporter ATP-binding protein EcfA2